jgi:hypothetical protein
MTIWQRITYSFMKAMLVVPATCALLLGIIIGSSYRYSLEEEVNNNRIAVHLIDMSIRRLAEENV